MKSLTGVKLFKYDIVVYMKTFYEQVDLIYSALFIGEIVSMKEGLIKIRRLSKGSKGIDKETTEKYIIDTVKPNHVATVLDSVHTKSLRMEIAAEVGEKMCYLNTCPNEREIILNTIDPDNHIRKVSHCATDCTQIDCKNYLKHKE